MSSVQYPPMDTDVQEDFNQDHLQLNHHDGSFESNDDIVGTHLEHSISANDSGFQSEDNLNYSTASDGYRRKVSVGCRKRKNFVPARTSPLNDPDFRGVTIFMENRLVNNEWKFSTRAEYSLSPKKKRKLKAYLDSSDEEDINNNNNSTPNDVAVEHRRYLQNYKKLKPTPILEKHCASCSVKKTPLWRDAEDGTPLCNACGIRYKKYKLRCGACWHIPKKDEFHPICQYCGSFYEYAYPRR